MMPGINAKALEGATIDEKALTRTEAIILSMTPQERENPSILNSSRKKAHRRRLWHCRWWMSTVF